MGYQHIANAFAPSGAIRVNSQKKLLDIWSIYKCTHCDYTWNIALFSRLHVSTQSTCGWYLAGPVVSLPVF
ncbi:hypothetical protein KPRYC492_22615 [Klebsiella pneumoniae RYC492]|nr:hypothetical protein KPRYC492_22615 [Klebsiella pneumoniae RYC492]